MPQKEISSFAMTTAFRISAACRHYAQASLRGRKWVPEDLLNKPAQKRTAIIGKTSLEAPPSASEDEDPEDEELEEIEKIKAMSVSPDWPSEFLRLISAEFFNCDFMDDDDYVGGSIFWT